MTGNVQLATEGQLDELRLSVQRSFNKLRGRLPFTTADDWLSNSSVLDRLLEQMLPEAEISPEAKPQTYLRRLFEGEQIVVGATDGKRTILDEENIFTAGIDGDFKKWDCCVRGIATLETPAEVYELVRDGRFDQFVPSVGRPLASLFWQSTAQITEFVKKHRGKLRGEGWANLFPFKVDCKKFVARVYLFSDGRLGVFVFHFSDVSVCFAGDRPRLVVPQLVTQ